MSFEPIEHALADEEPAVRTAAADALATVGAGQAPAHLLTLVADSEPASGAPRRAPSAPTTTPER